MLKRLMDFCGAAIAMVALFPLLICAAITIRLTMGRPVFFHQIRPGYFEKPFTIYKFRTMLKGNDALGNPLPDADRLHPVGSFLRRTSVDELPELWNVLRGDMSFVGPRPLLTRYLPFYTDQERIRFTVRPGITGWAQINGRNEASWSDRLQRDIWYVHNQSLVLDIKILWTTLLKVLRRDQVVVDARSIMLDLDEERAYIKQTATAVSDARSRHCPLG